MDFTQLLGWDEYVKVLVGLLAITNPFSLMPLFIAITEDYSESERKLALRVAISVFVATMLLMIFLGGATLDLFGITLPSFRIAGGMLLLFYSLKLLDLINIPNAFAGVKGGTPRSIGVVPLGIPVLAGPGAISTVILNANAHPSLEHRLLVFAVAVIIAALVYPIWRIGARYGDNLNPTTVIVANRVLGLLLAAIAVEFILAGVGAHFPGI